MVAPVVMEAAAREWTGSEDGESFREYLVRRAVLREEQVAELEAAVASEAAAERGAAGAPEGEKPPPPSEIIKGYRILERLGRGGMGSVYRAEQIGMNRTVALKILRRPLARDEQQVERLRREARLVGSLEHPNIVRGLDVGQCGPYHYFAMEFVEGETLRDRLKKRGAMPEAEVLRILEQICGALDHAHSRGVVHRDVKPGNIILTSEGVPKLTDYGLAKGPADFSLTQSGVTIGTPQYLSPEQARDPTRVDGQTDLYSLGATAYHMLTGVPPHTSETLAGLLTKVLYEKPRTARQVSPRVSAGASFLVEKLMAKQKRHRYRTPRDVLRDLGALAAGRSIVPRDWAGDFEVHELRRRFRRWVTVAAGVAVLALGSTVVIQHRAALEQERVRREAAMRNLDSILSRERPRTEDAWRDRFRDLEHFLATPEHERTPAAEKGRDRLGDARRHLLAWDDAGNALRFARNRKDRDRYPEAVRHLQDALGRLREDPPFGDDPATVLEKQIFQFRDEGVEAGRERVKAALEQARQVPRQPGAAARVEEILRAEREVLLDRFVESDAVAPVQALDQVVDQISRARVAIEDSILGPGHHEEMAEKLRDGKYASLMEKLEEKEARVLADADLQGILARIPIPAAWDLRQVVPREIERVLAENGTAVERALVEAGTLAREHRFEEAKGVLDAVAERSAPVHRERVAGIREEIADLERRTKAEREARVRSLLAAIVDDLGRRDLLGARKRLDDRIPDLAREPRGSALVEAVESARRLLALVEREAFDPIRARAEAGRPFDLGLKFVTGDRIHHEQVLSVRLERSPTGDVLVFDAPGQPGLRGALHNLSLDLVFAYADLPARGAGLEEALARGTLLVADGERWSREDVEGAKSLLRLARDGPEKGRGIPGVGMAVEALLVRADALVEEKLRREENLERIAQEHLASVQRVLDAGNDPRKALEIIDSLRAAPLSGTRAFRDNRELIQSFRKRAEQQSQDLRLQALWPKWRISTSEDPTLRDPRTRAECGFEDRGQLGAFVPREDGGQRLFLIPLQGGGANGAGGHHLVFVDPEPGMRSDGTRPSPFDSPLTLECPFKPGRPMALSCRVKFPGPSYPYLLQFSLVGNHVLVATDDGRRESGRGVFAYKAQEWYTPDAFLPDAYRHGYVQETYVDRGIDPLTVGGISGQEGIRYFQLQADREYAFRVELANQHLKLFVDGNLVWDAELKGSPRSDTPPRIRIASYTPCTVDDLVVEGFVDQPYLNKLLWK